MSESLTEMSNRLLPQPTRRDARMNEEIERLRRALEKYGNHTYSCGSPSAKCSCGWDDLALG